jgi:hypothetical protein
MPAARGGLRGPELGSTPSGIPLAFSWSEPPRPGMGRGDRRLPVARRPPGGGGGGRHRLRRRPGRAPGGAAPGGLRLVCPGQPAGHRRAVHHAVPQREPRKARPTGGPAVRREIETTGTYWHTPAELFDARVAWRNSSVHRPAARHSLLVLTMRSPPRRHRRRVGRPPARGDERVDQPVIVFARTPRAARTADPQPAAGPVRG